ncbi:MAG: FadR family transcriptional regulator [Sandaracinaceae bacterium]|nr:MAG: FadR family transcriptional regulator [Sandaracinaceae bacterium]
MPYSRARMPEGTAVDTCEAAIRDWILSGEVSPGERLPPERRLAERLGVNRTTLRGALSRLASARLLTVRQGSGYVVQDYRRVAGLELLPEVVALAEARGDGIGPIVKDLLEVRRRLATMALERFVDHPRPGAADRVEAAVDRFAELMGSSPTEEEVVDADLAVIGEFLEASGSAVLGLCLNPISFVVQSLAPLRTALYVDPDTNVAAYRLLVLWMRSPSRDAIARVAEQLERRDAETVARVTRAAGEG